ncbi:MAG TPA: nucleotidyltransferase family protein [Terracidiphilus sp.]|nr:nucleotidyltransferase family protein [Terracidiphilus sp.]
MKAMVLAAGLGTRLRPLTNDRPKALVEVAGRTMLEIVLERLRSFGVHEVIVNTHYFAGMIKDYLRSHGNFGMRIEISHEEDLLDTGGGLKKAAWFFLEDGNLRSEPFIVHNVDVISSIDLRRMMQFHVDRDAIATLAAQDRKTSRPLLFDEDGRLRGRGAPGDESARPEQSLRTLAFSGIHVVSPRLFEKMHEQGAFSIIDAYLRLAALGEKIVAFPADQYDWLDLGRPEHVAQAASKLAVKKAPGNPPEGARKSSV